MIHSTEAGLVAESISRPKGDPYWNYLQFFDNIRPFVWMKPVSNSNALYECVYLAGHPALTASNSTEPPGSFHSKDVFTPHPTIPNRWKYVSRLDDRINLSNGEKVLPLPIEGLLKQHPLVHDAVVVGIGKAAPGLLVVQANSPEARKLSVHQFIISIWPMVQKANSRAEAFSQISRDLITILPHDAQFPRTDKGSMIRAEVYKVYSDLIESLYNHDHIVNEGLELSVHETESILFRLAREDLEMPLSTVDANFFSEGLDSLKAIHFRRLILRRFKFNQTMAPGPNVVFESGNISTLAKRICAMQMGNQLTEIEDGKSQLVKVIEKYSRFQGHTPQSTSFSSTKSVVSKTISFRNTMMLTLKRF